MTPREARLELVRRKEIEPPSTIKQQIAESSGQAATRASIKAAQAYGAVFWHRMTEAQRQQVERAAADARRSLVDFVAAHNRRIRKGLPDQLRVAFDREARLNRQATKAHQRTHRVTDD